jgi:Xaa-Pro dipeptidase
MLLNRARASKIMEKEGLDGLIATTPENVTYLTDHHGHYWQIRAITVLAALAKDVQEPVLVAPASDITPLTPTDINVVAYGGIPLVISDIGEADEYDRLLLERRKELELLPGAMQALYKAVRDLGLSSGRVAVDERNFTRGQFAALGTEFPKAEFVDGYELFRLIRAVKTEEEVNRLRISVQATEAGITNAVGILEPGVTEKELEIAFNVGVTEAGAVPVFSVICSDHRSAHTNTVPGNRIVQRGDVVRLDLGSVYRYYYSDIARTFVVGTEPTESQQLYWDAIVAGEKAAMEALRPGVTAGEVFRIAVETCRESGIPNFERNHVGHGIGIELYDMPVLTPGNDTAIEEGMVFCVETPVYEVGYAGLQVEDTMVVRKDGIELLSSYQRDLYAQPIESFAHPIN